MVTKRKFTREFKLSVLNELATKTQSQVCREHDLGSSVIYKWKKEYQSNPKEAFSGNGKIYKEDAKLVQYERLVGQLYAENAFLKKSLENLQQRNAEEKIRRQSSE